MKKIFRTLLLFVFVAATFSSCIKETEPQGSTITSQQIAKTPGAVQKFEAAMDAWFITYNCGNQESHNDFGYSSLWMMRDFLGQDMTLATKYASWWTSWYQVQYLGPEYANCQRPWRWYYKLNYQANSILDMVKNPAEDTEANRISAGKAYFYRAFVYFDLVRLYQYTYKGHETDPSIPIVTNEIEELANNPRAAVQDVYELILGDLAKAEEYLTGYTRGTKTTPDLSVVYGMYARVYLTMENFEQAEKYAKLAQSGYSALNEAEWTSQESGFNTPNHAWLWCMTTTTNDDVVQTGIINFIAHMSNEADFGYTGAGCYKMMDAHLYSQIAADDWRRDAWCDPAIDKASWNSTNPAKVNFPVYASLKFRPGSNSFGDFSLGAASSVPLMRVEEMMLIEAEAAGMQDLARGKQLLEAFAKTRQPSFTSKATSSLTLRDEIWFQRRVELWGEGFATFDIKRLNKGITRSYTGTNHFVGALYNTTDVPAWMNYCIVRTETMNNFGLGDNNPEVPKPDDSDPAW